MPKEEIKLGPFIGGLNTFSDPTAIDDLELVVCDNFDMYFDGTLVNRPPIKDLNIDLPLGVSGNMKILGWFVSAAGAPFLIASNGLSSTYYFDGTTWTLITATIAASTMVQYKDKVWLVAPPGSANPGGSWAPVGGFVAIPTMPKGNTVVVQKERLWIGPGKNVTTNGSRVYFCAIADATTWNGDFISINTGDGQNVLALVVYFQDLLIFKNDSTYRFTYDLDPSLGQISTISDTVGILDTGCTTTFENRVFVLHNSYLYELTNYTYECVNDRVPFKANNESTLLSELAFVSYYGNRVFVSFFDRLFVWSVKTRTWSTWTSTVLSNVGAFYPIPGEQSNTAIAYTYSRTPREAGLYEVEDGIGANSEDMTCTIVTKNYDYQAASRFKKLFQWGLDCTARDDIVGTVTPIEYASTVTWGELKTHTWAEVKATPWGRLLGSSSARIDPVSISSLTGERKFIKLGDRTLRFRQVNFKIAAHTLGNTTTAPVIIYNLITYVNDKQAVSKRIS